MDHAADDHAQVVREEQAIQHPLGVYFKIWILLVVIDQNVSEAIHKDCEQ